MVLRKIYCGNGARNDKGRTDGNKHEIYVEMYKK